MIDDDNIWHVYPINDRAEHLLTSIELKDMPHCQCDCEPRVRREGDGFVIVHNSFDGREGVEWTNDILLTK